jgi:hypothetical protein
MHQLECRLRGVIRRASVQQPGLAIGTAKDFPASIGVEQIQDPAQVEVFEIGRRHASLTASGSQASPRSESVTE